MALQEEVWSTRHSIENCKEKITALQKLLTVMVKDVQLLDVSDFQCPLDWEDKDSNGWADLTHADLLAKAEAQSCALMEALSSVASRERERVAHVFGFTGMGHFNETPRALFHNMEAEHRVLDSLKHPGLVIK